MGLTQLHPTTSSRNRISSETRRSPLQPRTWSAHATSVLITVKTAHATPGRTGAEVKFLQNDPEQASGGPEFAQLARRFSQISGVEPFRKSCKDIPKQGPCLLPTSSSPPPAAQQHGRT